MKKYLLAAGLDWVDPDAYGGWDGRCPGCTLDARRVVSLCDRLGFDSLYSLLDKAATISKYLDVFAEQAAKLESGDLYVVYQSSHGGQTFDQSGDELDGKDETLCMWDGELLDDHLGHMFSLLQPGVRVLFITDTCNSGTNYRAKQWPKTTPVRFGQALPRDMDAELIHLGGCEDGKSSYGTPDGGVFTNALLQAFRIAEHEGNALTPQQLFHAASNMMPRNQQPVYDEYGVGTVFRTMNLQTTGT